MKKILWVVVLFCVPGASAQQAWMAPKLHEIPWTQTIGSGKVHLSVNEALLVKRVSRESISRCVKYPGPGDPTTAKGLFESLRVARVKIAPDGERALLVQGNGVCMCGATGNCPFWVIGGTQGSQVLLAGTAIHWFEFERQQTKSRFNLVLGSHDSAMETFLQQFRFDGTKYGRDGCALFEYDDMTGNPYPKPKISPTPCN